MNSNASSQLQAPPPTQFTQPIANKNGRPKILKPGDDGVSNKEIPKIGGYADYIYPVNTEYDPDLRESDAKIPLNIPDIYVPRPSNRPVGDALSPDTLNFMAFLAVNGSESFLRLYQDKWAKAQNDFSGFIKLLGQELRHDIDDKLSDHAVDSAVGLPYTQQKHKPKVYHPYLHACFERQTYRHLQLGYFISVQPGDKTTVSVGLRPTVTTEILKHLRNKVIKEAELLRETLSTPMIKEFLGSDDIGLDLLDSQAKTLALPPGVSVNDPNADALRCRYFLVTIRFDDIYVVSGGFLDNVLDIYAALRPFVDLLFEWLDAND